MVSEPVALVASFIAMVFVVMSYFVKKKGLYLLFQLLCIIFLVVSYFFEAKYFAMIGLVVGLGRTLTFFLHEKKGVQASIFWPFLFSGLTVAVYFIVNIGILKEYSPYDMLCLVALVAYAFIFRIRNLKVVRFCMIVPTVLSISFNLLTHAAIFATLTYVFELLANLISIVKYHILPQKK